MTQIPPGKPTGLKSPTGRQSFISREVYIEARALGYPIGEACRKAGSRARTYLGLYASAMKVERQPGVLEAIEARRAEVEAATAGLVAEGWVKGCQHGLRLLNGETEGTNFDKQQAWETFGKAGGRFKQVSEVTVTHKVPCLDMLDGRVIEGSFVPSNSAEGRPGDGGSPVHPAQPALPQGDTGVTEEPAERTLPKPGDSTPPEGAGAGG